MKALKLFVGADYEFIYTNHRGETATRKTRFMDAHYGTAEPYYKTPRLLFHMFDYGKQAPRSFDPASIDFNTWRQLSVSYGEG